jgi:dsRNA-specific ribonuclease
MTTPLTVTDHDVRAEIDPQTGQTTYIFDPYNPLNQEITREEVEAILREHGLNVPIYNLNLYKRAFIHESYIKRAPPLPNTTPIIMAAKPENCLRLFSKSYEGLENLGDGVLEIVTQTYLYDRFPKYRQCPKFITDKKIAIVNNEAIGQLALDMGWNKWLILSKHAESKMMRTHLKTLGDIFEAFIGAIYRDFSKIQIQDTGGWFSNLFRSGPGFQMAQVFSLQILETQIDWTDLIQTDNNHKNILQIMIQKEFKLTPLYLNLSPPVTLSNGKITKPDTFNMGVFVCLGQETHEAKPSDAVDVSTYESYNDIRDCVGVYGKLLVFLGKGTNKQKKKAEQQAAQLAIEALQRLS